MIVCNVLPACGLRTLRAVSRFSHFEAVGMETVCGAVSAVYWVAEWGACEMCGRPCVGSTHMRVCVRAPWLACVFTCVMRTPVSVFGIPPHAYTALMLRSVPTTQAHSLWTHLDFFLLFFRLVCCMTPCTMKNSRFPKSR